MSPTPPPGPLPPSGEPHDADDRSGLCTVHSILRSLLRADSDEEAVSLLLDAVRRLGGEIVPAHRADGTDRAILPVDLSFGLGQPLLPIATSDPVRLRLERHLPPLVEDVRLIVERLRSQDRLTEDATTDPLTGLLNRRALGRVLGRLAAGSAVALLDFDHFKALNDAHGHAVGDQVLGAFAQFLRDRLRLAEHCARFGGEEFALVFPGVGAASAARGLERLRAEWADERPWPVSFSAGVAEIATSETSRHVLDRADRALYRAKGAGRDRVELAEQDRGDEPTGGVRGGQPDRGAA